MTRSLWLAALLIAAALLAHAMVPRYEWRPLAGLYWVRIDRWTGTAVYGRFEPSGAWAPGRDASAVLDAEIDRYLSSLTKK
jgi:hypothetical protein